MQIKLVGLNARFTHSCLALFYVRNELERHIQDVRVDLCQLTINDQYYETLLRVSEGDFDYIFFSAAVWNSDRVEQLICDLRKILPACGIVVGGPQAKVVGEHLAKLCTVVAGDIEAVAPEFYRDLVQHTLQATYMGSFLRMPARDLDFPYREEDFTSHLRDRNVYYESSRGCPFSCSYCLSSAEQGVFYKDSDQIQRELLHILRHRPGTIRFVDRTFNDRPDRALTLWRFLLDQEGSTLFHFEIVPDRFSEEMFEFLRKVPAGRFQFEIGVQSTHKPTLEAVGRRIDPVLSLSNIRRLVEIGTIFLHVDLILGLPDDTPASFGKSFCDVFATGAQYLQMGLLKLLPDTAINCRAADCGYVSSQAPPYPLLANRWMDHAVLGDLYWLCECVEKFVNNRYFISFWDYLRRTEVDVFVFFQEMVKLCKREKFFSLAPTQELMVSLLIEKVKDRNDAGLLLEILRYDWLRCGHRFLPSSLQIPEESEQAQMVRDVLYQKLPAELNGVYGRGQKNQFFRKGYFLNFTGKCLRELGVSEVSEDGVLVFLTERSTGLYRLSKTVLLKY